jgi:hypothetical protein
MDLLFSEGKQDMTDRRLEWLVVHGSSTLGDG